MSNKFLKSILIYAILFSLGCTKNVLHESPYDLTDGMGLVKINYSCPYYSNPGVMVKINGNVVSSLITYSTPYPGGGLNTGGNTYADYLSVKPGNDTFSLVVPISGTSIPDRTLLTTVLNIKENIYQTVHFTDTASNTKAYITQDWATRPDSGKVLYRFVNLIPNAPVGLDLYFDTSEAFKKPVASNIGYLQATDTFSLDAGTSSPWALKLNGVNGLKVNGKDSFFAVYSSVNSVANQRVFTIYARGYCGLPTTDVRSSKISFEYNK
ncbi:MAG: DUF4397 domain-containing protein [Arachidicoccus sp.]|nr:DUF4397 domain-containing protein [Arachidicoccus sp.]